MKKPFANKTAVFVLGIISILVLVVVTSRLASLEFKPAAPFSMEGDSGGKVVQMERLDIPFRYLIYCAVAIFLILTIFALIVLPPKQRWKFLLTVALLLATFMVLQYMFTGPRVEVPAAPEITPTTMEMVDSKETPLPEGIPAKFTPPRVSPWMSYAVALVVTLAAALVTWFLLLRRKRSMPSLEALGEIAQTALDDLQAGKDWARTVEGAYLRMTAVVQQRRGLKRREHVTPAEFAVVLEKIGLPAEAIRQLTGLFERVRYGGKRSTQKDIKEAIACLTEIVDACQEVQL